MSLPESSATENTTGREPSSQPPQDTGPSSPEHSPVEERSAIEERSAVEERSEGKSEEAALTRLFRRASRYRHAEEYKRFLDFVGRFPRYSPYNAALLHVQNPGVSFTATRRQWQERFDRVPEPGARPYVILQPFGPVLFVYDLPDTEPRSKEAESEEAEELPEAVTDPFAVEGTLSEDTWAQTLRNCRLKEKVAVRWSEDLHRRRGGRIERKPFQAGPKNTGDRLSGDTLSGDTLSGDCRYRVLLNKNLRIEEQYGALAHELGHLFGGHLGTDDGAWWDECTDAGRPQKEIEAESVAYLACRRAGLHSISERYLHWHAERAGGSSEDLLPPVRMRTVLNVAGYIESMGKEGFESKRDEDKQGSSAASY